jgi:hypothetical protein
VRRALLAVVAAPLALAGCMEPAAPPAPVRPQARTFAVDMQGKSAQCTATVPARPADGTTVRGTMAVLSDGGWCDFEVLRPGEGWRPFVAGLVTKRAQHGTVSIHTVGNGTRVDYAPDRGFAGADTFTLRLLPGDAMVEVAVTVTAPPPPPAPPAPPAPPPAPARRR